MKEEVLIKSQRCNIRRLFLVVFGIIVLVGGIPGIVACSDNRLYYHNAYELHDHTDSWYGGCYNDNGELMCPYSLYSNSDAYARAMEPGIKYIAPVVFVGLLIGGLLVLWLGSYELTVTDKRIYGKVIFGKRVDLPLDSVSATATGLFKGISVSTSSGKIKFRYIKNADEIHQKINELLINRQEKSCREEADQQQSVSNADEIKKYKNLLDMGAISQEEFDKKKKQLLGF